jgi:hypothetical protein
MSQILRKYFSDVVATDIADYGYNYGQIHRNFFTETSTLVAAICTNPPYDQSESFIRHALTLVPVVAMLLRNEYDCAASRVDLFNQPPFARQVMLTSRPRWIPNTTVAPRHNFSWFIWDANWTREPVKNYHVRSKE